MEYKLILILSYFHSTGGGYSYSEMKDLFGISYKQMDRIIDNFIEQNYLCLEKYYKVTPKGINLLQEYGFLNINLLQMVIEEEIFGKPMSIDTVYIPKKFMQK